MRREGRRISQGKYLVSLTSTLTPATTTTRFAPLRRRNDPTRKTLLELTLARESIERLLTTSKPTHIPDLRDRLHRLPWLPHLTPQILDSSRLLSHFLPKLLSASDKLVPWDLKLDAKELLNKWKSGDLSGDPLRGVTEPSSGGRGRGFDSSWPYARSCNVPGHNGLVVGQWFPLQITCVRDGAHGEMEAGIHGTKTHGALSVILSGGADNTGSEYEDDDLGSSIFYCGTKNSKNDGVATRATQYLLDAEKKKGVVRVLRSAKCGSRYAPDVGIRYDGLYRVTGKIPMGEEREAHYRFTLVREEGQPPIRCAKDWEGERRPTKYERNWRAGEGKMLGMEM
ncbi:hypothetical protein BJ508DRAFT_44235 [Ascobolus immersus RN42]|uniref:YDG domain-containing protein n=1 Tax=Ascobolus immersus RN42 TaxID=1160509 RepID=A0A3N4HJ31_ASCIM|nr:hypothetical protein BJ508DRAFT_44235 [Ascobolus immersus RN42]